MVFAVFVFLNLTLGAALPTEPFILYSNLTSIIALDLNTYAQSVVLGGRHHVVPLGVDTVNDHIYFGEPLLGHIYRANYDGSSLMQVMEGVKNIEGMAIDWIGGKLYWTTFLLETIEVATLNGEYRKVLINTGLQHPRGIAVDPKAGYVQ